MTPLEDIRYRVERLDSRFIRYRLTDWERGFLRSLGDQLQAGGQLSLRQQRILDRLFRQYVLDPPAPSRSSFSDGGPQRVYETWSPTEIPRWRVYDRG